MLTYEENNSNKMKFQNSIRDLYKLSYSLVSIREGNRTNFLGLTCSSNEKFNAVRTYAMCT